MTKTKRLWQRRHNSESTSSWTKPWPRAVQKARVKSRIILTPEHAKRLLRSLQENIVRYESSVGKIEIPTPAGTPDAGPKMGQA